MEHNPSSEADSSTASHNSPHFMEHDVARSPIKFFKIHSEIILLSLPRSSNTLFPSHILTKILYALLFSPEIYHVPFDRPNNIL